jgi:hypothetical protein
LGHLCLFMLKIAIHYKVMFVIVIIRLFGYYKKKVLFGYFLLILFLFFKIKHNYYKLITFFKSVLKIKTYSYYIDFNQMEIL